MSIQSTSRLTPNRRWLVDTIRWIGFGQIKGLAVRGGEPQPRPEPEVVVEWKFGAADNGPRPESPGGRFALKSQVTELLDRLDDLGDVVIDAIEVRHGLPFRLITTQSPPTPLA